MEYQLSIYIPTYNRPSQIQRQVRCLLKQLTKQVKLVVVDNCSQTPVESLFTKEELSLFKIVRNPINIGGDANIARCHELCDTEWLWVLGDDDFVNENAVNIVLSFINEYPDVVWLNFEAKENLFIDNAKLFFLDLKHPRNFSDSFWISKCVYNNQKLKPYIYYYYANLSSMVGQIIMVLKYALDKDDFSCLKCSQRIFVERTPGGWGLNLFLSRLGIFFDSFSDKEKKILMSTVFYGVTKMRISRLTNSNGAFKIFCDILLRYGFVRTIFDFHFLLIKKMLIVLLPNSLFKSLRKIKTKLYD